MFPIKTIQYPTIAVTAGEPAGIGPELCALLAQRPTPARLVVIADRDLLKERARSPLKTIEFTLDSPPAASGSLLVQHVPLAQKSTPGKLNPANSAYVLAMIKAAVSGCLEGIFDAMVTAPAHKGVIADAGITFTGHTEYLAQLAGGIPVMMLIGGGIRAALATTHAPLKDVPQLITRAALATTLRVLERDLRLRFGIAEPRILVAGLNPHAGESGHLGKEEIEIIIPALDSLRSQGMHLVGPLSADTIFSRERRQDSDCVLAMYHDQVLPVIKYASFGEGVNITLGLPIIRTSVDHGTALELAGTGRADCGSLLAAIGAAVEMVARSQVNSTRA
ncbi:MAG: 4-hydroxythreonine-4-phosphate dehydrogenase PdxA [Burkholderiales bacterium]